MITKKNPILQLLSLILMLSIIVCSVSAQGAETTPSTDNASINFVDAVSEGDIARPSLSPGFRYEAMFEMEAYNASDLMISDNSYSWKNFTKQSLNGASFMIAGTLYNTSEQIDISTKVGACYYDYYENKYVAVTSDYFYNGVYTETPVYLPSTFKNGKTYFGYINNYKRYATVYGEITLYKAFPDLELMGLEPLLS